jgi:hypothetical protein
MSELNLRNGRSFITSMWAWVKGGCKIEDDSVAEARSRICEKCPRMVKKPTGCPGCFARKAMIFLYGGMNHEGTGAFPFKNNPRHKKLHYCGVCGCDLKLKVYIPKDVLPKADKNHPEACWLQEEPSETPPLPD